MGKIFRNLFEEEYPQLKKYESDKSFCIVLKRIEKFYPERQWKVLLNLVTDVQSVLKTDWSGFEDIIGFKGKGKLHDEDFKTLKTGLLLWKKSPYFDDIVNLVRSVILQSHNKNWSAFSAVIGAQAVKWNMIVKNGLIHWKKSIHLHEIIELIVNVSPSLKLDWDKFSYVIGHYRSRSLFATPVVRSKSGLIVWDKSSNFKKLLTLVNQMKHTPFINNYEFIGEKTYELFNKRNGLLEWEIYSNGALVPILIDLLLGLLDEKLYSKFGYSNLDNIYDLFGSKSDNEEFGFILWRKDLEKFTIMSKIAFELIKVNPNITLDKIGKLIGNNNKKTKEITGFYKHREEIGSKEFEAVLVMLSLKGYDYLSVSKLVKKNYLQDLKE